MSYEREGEHGNGDCEGKQMQVKQEIGNLGKGKANKLGSARSGAGEEFVMRIVTGRGG